MSERADDRAHDYKRAKAPRTPAAGPYGHPIHPLLVTVAIGAKRLIDIGLITATGAAMFGLLDFLQIPPRTDDSRTTPGPSVRWYQRGMSIVTAMSLLASGWLGGSLTYHYGVRVADEDHQKQTGYSAMDAEARTQTFMENLR